MRFLRLITVLLLGSVVAAACGGEDSLHGDPHDGGGGESGGKGGAGGVGGSKGGASSGSGGEGLAGTGGEGEGGGGKAGGGEGGEGGACPGCSSDACLDDGTCVDCTADRHCGGGTPRCDLGANECVACLPADDQCPEGTYCSTGFACVPGCKADASCASSSCLGSHDCEPCVTDAECAGGRVCGAGRCLDPCVVSQPTSCPTDLTCCSSHCVETDYDIAHCGACDQACTTAQFCSTQGCAGATFANVCKIERVLVIIDNQPGDIAPAHALGAALAAQCAPAPTVLEVAEPDATAINPSTGQPLGGGDVLALAGGPFGQATIRFLDTARSTPIYPTQTPQGMYQFRRTDNDAPIVTFAPSSLSASHDFIVIQLARDTLTGTLVIMAYGFNEHGTAAAVWYFSNVILPSLGTHTSAWYAFEWTDDGDAMPDAGDTFAPLP